MAKFDITNLMNNVSKAKMEELASENSLLEVQMLDVELLVESENNFYRVDDVKELADSIELLGGIQQNLVVQQLEDGKYEVIAGHRRRKAVLQLLAEGKEEYRMVPCKVRKGAEGTLNELALILTNSTARELSDFEKIKQVQVLKNLLIQYKEQLAEENKDKPEEEKVRIGRIRDVIADMLNVSPATVGRMEKVDKNLSEDFKEELKDGNINMSTAVSISVKSREEQRELYEQYQREGEIHIKDVDKNVDREEEKQREHAESPCEEVSAEVVDKPTIHAEVKREVEKPEHSQEQVGRSEQVAEVKKDRQSFGVFCTEHNGVPWTIEIDDMIRKAIYNNYDGTIDEFGLRRDLVKAFSSWCRENTEQYSLYLNRYYNKEN